MEGHRAEIRDFRELVVLQATQDNTELQLATLQALLSQAPASRRSSRTAEVAHSDAKSTYRMRSLRRADEALRVAQATRPAIMPAETESPLSNPTINSLDLRHIIADYAERHQLDDPQVFERATLPEIEYLSDVEAEHNDSVPPNLMSPAPHDDTSAAPHRLPVAAHDLGHNDHSMARMLLPQIRDARSLSSSWRHALGHAELGTASLSNTNQVTNAKADTLHLPQPALDADSASIATTIIYIFEDSIEPVQLVNGAVMLVTPYTGSKGMPCDVTITQIGSLYVQAVTKRTFPADSMPSLGENLSMTSPFIAPRRESTLIHEAPTSLPLVFRHALTGGLASFPRIIHPSAEIANYKPNTYPYAVEFYTYQMLSLPALNIIFQAKADRDLVREKMFGKQLLASVGVDRVDFELKQITKPCWTQPMSLWKTNTKVVNDVSTININSAILSITVQCNSADKNTKPDSAMELEVLGARNISPVVKSTGKDLELRVRVLGSTSNLSSTDPTSPKGGPNDDPQSSDTSVFSEMSYDSQTIEQAQVPKTTRKLSFLSIKKKSTTESIKSPSKSPNGPEGKSGMQTPGTFSCFVRFTETTAEYVEQKLHFLKQLEESVRR
ncbi:hypothetical protein LTR66_015046 [Elasticomyces elasticus]|nr:hypothetical protein LTR66_015046 [Elasticomyces elasticus]